MAVCVMISFLTISSSWPCMVAHCYCFITQGISTRCIFLGLLMMVVVVFGGSKIVLMISFRLQTKGELLKDNSWSQNSFVMAKTQ